MKSKAQVSEGGELIETWPLTYAATLGSSVRVRGIFLEVRAGLPAPARKALKIEDRALVLQMPADSAREFRTVSAVITDTLETIESLPLIPREIEDVLSISTTERHRWLKDGRLPSAGTRSVKLRGRAKKVTFHVFDPRLVEDILDRDVVDAWREQDAETAAENRRRAAWKAKLTRSKAKRLDTSVTREPAGARPQGWEEFERDGPLR